MIDEHPFSAPGRSVPPTATTQTLAPDLLRGAEEIAGFLFGNTMQRRKVYHLAETSRLPVFHLTLTHQTGPG